ncbi:CGLD27 family protein [Synechococcus elongatus]|uniref:CGLD27 family protein n=1 Tax=Synechococcus elongatus PCC 11801 TaxID=2219813 RepID=A0AAN1QLQ7_SYNEL|nr:CGLD27 family protein [Synechococcus elongatus]AZB71680.1 DUF1230 domain-containing protein [Synechococcus elongatus PCC 11801]
MRSVCPVPEEQQPLNEYQTLQDSWFFSWVCRPGLGYYRPLLWIWGWSWLIAAPVAAASFRPSRAGLEFVLSAAAGAAVPVLFAQIQLYSGWRHVRDRLAAESVPYEESGWYDGQFWQKPSEVLARDRLLASYEVQPLLDRLRQSIGRCLAFIGISALLIVLLRAGL